MTDAHQARRTPLHDRHAAAGARFVSFAGWEMPVSYPAGIIAEHQAVRTQVGLFDVSHMGEIEIRGDDAIAATNRLITNDLERIADGQALYTAMCLPSGGIVDDLVVYRFGRDRVLICCNAGNRDKDFAWIREHLTGATAVDRGDEFAQLAVQGPHAEALLQPLTAHPLTGLRRYWFEIDTIAGVDDVIISRTGYTGEDGFELYAPAEHGPALWDAIMAAGEGMVTPIGLGARDTLRLEMKYALYGNDIDETTSPLEAGLGWVVKLDKPDFIGKKALVDQKAGGIPRRLVAFRMNGKGAPARPGYPVLDAEGEPIGHVTSGTRSPTLGVNIGLAYVPTGHHKIGSPLLVKIRDKMAEATIVKPPFVEVGA